MNKTTSTLWRPGMSNDDRHEVTLTERDLRALAWLADRAASLNLGLHCSICAQDVHGENLPTDAVVRMACGCRTFSVVNEQAR